MYVVDPLIEIIEECFTSGNSATINQKRDNYGNPDDISRLTLLFENCRQDLLNHLSKYRVDSRRYILVDLTPFTRIGNIPSLINSLNEFKDTRPILLYMSPYVDTEIKASFQTQPIVSVSFTSTGELERVFGGSMPIDGPVRNKVESDLSSLPAPHISSLRRWISQQKLVQMLLLENALYSPVHNPDDASIVNLAGRVYKRMPNQMLITSYIDIKLIARESRNLIELVYEAILELQHHYTVPTSKNSEFDLIVAPNNTAFYIGSALQTILGKPVIPIDRLGPVPRLPKQREHLRRLLQNQRCAIFEEVVATGNELDRTILFLKNIDVEISKILALYNLGVGRSMMADAEKFISLCFPKQEIGYVYRSY